MSISDFCTSFGLQASILKKLDSNAYDFARNLRFISLDNLTEMGFKLGERAALQDAVERWSLFWFRVANFLYFYVTVSNQCKLFLEVSSMSKITCSIFWGNYIHNFVHIKIIPSSTVAR